MVANLWERHRLSEKLNGKESVKGEAGEEEEWRYGPMRLMATACGHRQFRLTNSCWSEFAEKTEVEEIRERQRLLL